VPTFKFGEEKDYNKYDGIILAFEKGGLGWEPDVERGNTKTFSAIGDFDSFSVISLPITDDKVQTSDQFVSLYSSRLGDKFKFYNADHPNEEASSHHLFAFSTRPDSDAFWDTKTLYTFISLIQFKINFAKFKDSVNAVEKYLDKVRREKELLFDYRIYQSLDVSDICLFIKTNKLNVGKTCIAAMTKEFEADFYSYSKTGFSTEHRPDEYPDDDTIDKMMVCAVIDQPKRFKEWQTALIRKLKELNLHYTEFERLGHEDYCVNICGMKVSDFLKELRDGLFSRNDCSADSPITENSINKNAIMRPRINFDSSYPEFEDVNKFRETRVYNKPTIFTRYVEVCKNDDTIKKGIEENYLLPCINTALHEMFTAVGVLEKKHFARDVVKCINDSFELFIDELQNAFKKLSENSIEVRQLKLHRQILHDHVQGYIDAVMSMIHGVLRADRMFFQVPGFSSSLFDVPSKLILFYTAFVERLVNTLNSSDDSGSNFKFILNIGLHSQMSVRYLFDTNRKERKANRLLEIQIPVTSLFYPKMLMSQISHEVAHIVGGTVRCREERKNAMINAISELFIDRFYNVSLEELDIDNDLEELKNVYAYLFCDEHKTVDIMHDYTEYIRKYLKNYIKKLEGDDTALLTKNITKHLDRALSSLLSHSEFEVFVLGFMKRIQEDMHSGIKTDDEKQKLIAALNVFVEFIYANVHAYISKSELPRKMCNLLCESFSDIVMLKLSKLDELGYIKLFCDINGRFFKDGFDHNFAEDYDIERIHAVFEVYFGKTAEKFIGECNSTEEWFVAWAEMSNRITVKNENRAAIHRLLVSNVKLYLYKCLNKWNEIYVSGDQNKRDDLKVVQDIFGNTLNSTTLEKFRDSFSDICEKFYNSETDSNQSRR